MYRKIKIKKNKIERFSKDYHPKTILDNKKEFFVSHPTLNTAGIIKKKEQKYVALLLYEIMKLIITFC